MTIEEAHKALSLSCELTKYGIEIILTRIEAKFAANTSIVIQKWRTVARSPSVRKLPRLV